MPIPLIKNQKRFQGIKLGNTKIKPSDRLAKSQAIEKTKIAKIQPL
jgi:hypothetical protein